MSLCVKLTSNTRTCAAASGGVARIWLFDGADFDFTQAAAVSGVAQPYTAVALTTAAALLTDAKMYKVDFMIGTAQYSYKQSSKGGFFTKYEHSLTFQSPDLSQLAATWNQAIDKAGLCCGISAAILFNTGRILIAGEKSVNAAIVPVPFRIAQDGSSGDSGKLFDDPNAYTTMLKGDYGRALYEFTGGVAALTALEA